MKNKLFSVLICCTLVFSMLPAVACGSGDDESAEAVATEAETVEEDTEEVEEAVEEEAAGETEEEVSVSYVDGFYANDGNGSDFIIAFYEGETGDVAYVNDGTNEAFAEYVVENATTDAGDEYLLITVGETQIGYLEDGDEIYIIDVDGNVYSAARLTEEEADEIYRKLGN